MAQQKKVINIDKSIKPAQRKAIAQDIIEFIINRTQKGFDKNGKQFKGYKSSYIESAAFKQAGKTRLVDLTLSGEMMNSLELLNQRSGSITIGYDKNKKELNGKVEGNRKGTYGNKLPVQKPRDFLGLSNTALKRITRDFKREDDGEQ